MTLSNMLDDPRLFRQYAYVDGKWTHGDEGREDAVVDPATGEVLGHIPLLEAAQISAAVDAAEAAYVHWRALRADERCERLLAWYDLLQAHREDLALIMTREQGKPLPDARGEVEYGASFVRWFAEEGKRTFGETIPSHIPNAALGTLKEPVGIAALITPWNFPLAMITRKAAAAMAAGCPVIVKPAHETPFSALALAELAERAGIPAGIFNVVLGDAAEVSKLLCDEDRIKALSFTGSTRVGRLLIEQCAHTVKRVSLELGGNAPFIVGPDMDPKEAAYAAVAAKFQTAGQDCLAANRILVHESIHDAFVEQFAERMAALSVGNGLDGEVDLGPLIHRQAVEKAASIVDDAVSRGATLVAGDQNQAPGENFFMPTLLTGVTPQMKVWREENFAPVAGITAYRDDDEAIEMANDTEYGLAAYVYTHDIRRIWKLLRALEYGMVAVNSVKMTGPPVPFGGVKQSGLGREGGVTGIDEYLETKYYCLGALGSVSGS
ncbi:MULTISPECIES: NAD-dependent succinate-semialdehyde dehydrogenase [Halomonas]|uniref:NAD-dependent succinate-semialdehyde dehydrogenase n=1 Tax=Halomonas halophila TaxID=29573 RepID=A0ABQ0U331_9GAMM|nr:MULTISPECIES: NAD-dependent succinate-semialdehyde dehydrogenase [Halomonas]MDR5888798.1 NAD-dependent succinate-semialdehyde dehydrogenase [Halomonas salina]RAH38677.1 NAD-dependent succinate-semialdehyde dehydrogenase [Halomonas sp. SL1]WJY07978.1 NAD-dependent succinate-semialdehyde dehydrogenase [Halomonas halophila]GEK72118.1 NAD-dependent succinate-semialdehyde dehydrogenase [Halomonas halophila]